MCVSQVKDNLGYLLPQEYYPPPPLKQSLIPWSSPITLDWMARDTPIHTLELQARATTLGIFSWVLQIHSASTLYYLPTILRFLSRISSYVYSSLCHSINYLY